MRFKLKSRQIPQESPREPKYVEFIILAVLAVVGSTAIVVFLFKPVNTPPIDKASSIEITEDTLEVIMPVESDKNGDQQTESVGASPTNGQLDRMTQDETYRLTITAVEGSVVRNPDQAAYNHGETVLLEVVPNVGYSFTNWSGDLSGGTNPIELVMDADKSVTADFAIKTYSLNVTAVDGSVVRNPDQAAYNHGETVILEVVPNAGYSFTNWSGDLSGDTNPTRLVMDADKSVIADFAAKTYNLTATAVDGSIVRSPAQTTYKYGDTVTLEAIPDEGYSFTNWSGDLFGSANPAELVIDADKSVTAGFDKETYSLNVTVDGGLVTKRTAQADYKHGDTVILEAVPNTGYLFTNWSGDLSGDTNPSKLIMDADKSVTARFTLTEKASDITTKTVDIKLVYIPAGSFMMGSSNSAAQLAEEYDSREADFADELPQHEVYISKDFWMGQTEVTQGQYEAVMNSKPWSGKAYVREDANNPAVYVSWEEAMEFCRKLSLQEGKTYRLPTEAEWEYACRAGTTTRFSFSDSDSPISDYAWFEGNADKVSQDYAHQVSQKKPNPWGLFDMHGNVFEWCSDYYDENYYSQSPSIDPNGPSSGTSRSIRSGSWDNDVSYLRSSYRSDYRVDRGLLVGFRVVTDGEAYNNTGTASISVELANNSMADIDVGKILFRIDSVDGLAGVTDDNLKTQKDEELPVEVPTNDNIPDDDQLEVAGITDNVPDSDQLAVVDTINEVAIDTDSTLTYGTGNAYDILDLAAVDARNDKVEQALAALSLLLEDEDVAVMAGYELGLIHYENGEVEKAMPFFKDALSATFPGSVSGRDEQALSALLNQEADAAQIRYELGLIYQSQGKQDQAARLFRDSMSIISTKGATYVGTKKCKSCHFKRWNSWRKTKMATTFEVLKPGVRSEEKTILNFDPDKDYTTDTTCLSCHTSGFGMPGGYIVPVDGETEVQEQAEDNAGVTCEGCHGPGSESIKIFEDIKENKRSYTFDELQAVGFQKTDVRSCTPCHNTSDPGKEPGYHFVYEENRTGDQHENFELEYRKD